MTRNLLTIVAAIVVIPLHALAQGNDDAKKAFMGADHKMMEAMHAVTMTGDPDKDFVAMMLPHHQGAVDMAKVELQYGKDPKLRALAEAIVKAQEDEIAEMKAWQAAHP
jgi:uncharacterized protein (DUF305 family)